MTPLSGRQSGVRYTFREHYALVLPQNACTDRFRIAARVERIGAVLVEVEDVGAGGIVEAPGIPRADLAASGW